MCLVALGTPRIAGRSVRLLPRGPKTLHNSWGSAAVLLVGWGAAVVGLAGQIPLSEAVSIGLVVALVGAVVEGLSNHGLDNLTIQIATSLTALWLAA